MKDNTHMEYFKITDKRCFYITRCLKKSHIRFVLQALNDIKKDNESIRIGICTTLVTKIISEHKICDDTEVIACKLSLPQDLINIVITTKAK